MIGRGLILLTILSNCVLSLPVTPSQLENEDVQVMKCIVEALADVLSRPHLVPVSQECLVTLKTDDRLVTILRHHNFLKELQEIAVQGGEERGELQRDEADVLTQTTQTLQTADDVPDRSMLEALGGPGERSILYQRKRMGKEESREDGESKEEEEEVKRGNEESISEPLEEWSEGEKRAEEEEYEEKRGNSEEENMTEDETGDEEKRNAPRNKSKEATSDEEDEEEKDKRAALASHKHKAKEEEEVMKKGSREGLKQWTKRNKSLKKKAVGKEAHQPDGQKEIPHHSKESIDEEEEKKKRHTQRSPEEKELQMIARRAPEERRVLEEEGSASRKSEEPEIESLAAIESELENVAQKLHDLRRG